MKHFLIFLSDKNKSLMTKDLIKDHVTYLDKYYKQGRILFCGPCIDETACMLMQAEDEKEALNLLQKDPFSKVQYYRSYKIVEFLLATPENNFHLEKVLSKL